MHIAAPRALVRVRPHRQQIAEDRTEKIPMPKISSKSRAL
jgi:hypothetical protein